jgi:hypothetical protein
MTGEKIKLAEQANSEILIAEKAKEYDRLWKIRSMFDKLNEASAKFYNPSEHLAVDEVILKFKGGDIFRQYIPKEIKSFGTNIINTVTNPGIYMTECTWVETHALPLAT